MRSLCLDSLLLATSCIALVIFFVESTDAMRALMSCLLAAISDAFCLQE